MKKLILELILVLVLASCGPSSQILLRPDVWVGGFYYPSYYWTYYPRSEVVVQNGTAYFLRITIGGRESFDLLPGEERAISVEVDYHQSRQLILTASAYYNSYYPRNRWLVGTANRAFYFYGAANQKRSELWSIGPGDVQKISPN